MKPVFIFLHGGPGFRDYLRPYFETLESDFRCVFYDQLRGAEVTMDPLLAQLDAIVESQQNKVVLIGHSWGGVLATQYALTHQEKLAGLVLMSTGLNITQWRDEFHAELAARNLEGAAPEKIYLVEDELQLGNTLLASTWEIFSEETFDQLFETYVKDYDLTQEIAKIQVPILNIFGDGDVRFPPRVSRTFRSFNQRIEDFEMKNAGHFPFLLEENRQKIVALLKQKFQV